MSNLTQNYNVPTPHSWDKKPKNKPRRDPMVIAMEKQYRASNQYLLDKLLRLERLFLKRQTLATNGLRKTRRQIMELLTKLAAEKLPNKVEDK